MHRFNVPEMTCGHCAGRVENAVKGIDPQAEITVDLAKKEVAIRSQAGGDKLSLAIRSAGYENSPLG
jgi:copper chaperone